MSSFYTLSQTLGSRKATPQSEAIPGRETEMVQNNAGGFSFILDKWGVLDRFLILGTEGGSYYVSEMKLSKDNAKNVLACIAEDSVRVVNRIVEISKAGRAPKNDPALFVLALVMANGSVEGKKAAYEALPQVARIGTHVLHLASFVNDMRGWGRGIRTAFGNWYNGKEGKDLAMQLVKYANRDGWTHRDILRLAHPKPATADHLALMQFAVGKEEQITYLSDEVSDFMSAVVNVKSETDAKKVAKLISDFKLPREVLPTEMLNVPLVWEALLPHMGMEALVRNLATLTRVGVISAGSDSTRLIIDKLGDADVIGKSRIHPVKILAGLLTYKAGHGFRGTNTWNPVAPVVDALDEMFYLAFKNVKPTNKRILLGLDISSSMTGGSIAGVPGLSPRVASAALAMITLATEKTGNVTVLGFHHQPKLLDLSKKTRLDAVVNYINGLGFGGTDCSLPMKWAQANKVPIDGFAVYTDNETWAGANAPVQALNDYRKTMKIASKSVVVGMLSNGFTIADPKDGGMLDVVGFDTATPAIISDFFAGR